MKTVGVEVKVGPMGIGVEAEVDAVVEKGATPEAGVVAVIDARGDIDVAEIAVVAVIGIAVDRGVDLEVGVKIDTGEVFIIVGAGGSKDIAFPGRVVGAVLANVAEVCLQFGE